MSKSTKQKPGAASSTVTDIPHEEVKNSENGLSHVPKVISTEDQIKLELAKFNIADSAIEAMKKSYGGLTIADANDKDGYKKVREAWSETRSTRTKLEKKGLELRNGYGVITKAIKKEEERLIELLTPLEDDLYKKWKDIDEEKDRIKREQEEEEQRQMMIRVEEVLGIGMAFKDGFYCVGDSISMDVATLRALPVDQYEKLKDKIVAKVTEIAEAKAAELEMQRIEAMRLQDEKDEMARQKEEMRLQREEMDRQKEDLANQQREAAKQKLENRINRLVGLGMFKKDADSLSFDNGLAGFIIKYSQIREYNGDDFEIAFKEAEADIKRLNIKKYDHEEQVNQEKAEKSRREKNIAGHMERIGMVYNYQAQWYEFKLSSDDGGISIFGKWEELLPMGDAEVEKWANKTHATILTAKSNHEKAEKERKLAAEKEENAAKSEKQRFDELMKELSELRDKFQTKNFKSGLFIKKAGYVYKALIEVVNTNK